MGPDAGRICIALRLQAVAQRVADMDRTSFADAVCDAVDAAGRLGYLGCLHAIVRLAAAREAMPDADGMTCGYLGCLAGLRRQARATDTLDAESFTARTLAALDIKGADRTAFQTAAMRLADMLAPVSPMVWPGVHGPHKARRVFLHLRALRRARGRVGMHALPVLRGVHGRPGCGRPRDGRGRPCRLVS